MTQSPLYDTYRDRLRLLAFAWQLLLVVGAALRIVLYAVFHAGAFSLAALARALVAGSIYDALVGALVLAPAAFLLAALRLRAFGSAAVRAIVLGGFGAAAAFGAVVEYFFFEEFNSRLNHIALDYLLHPGEVFGNIRDSYDVPLYAVIAIAGGLAAGALGARRTRGARFGCLPWSARWRAVLVALGGATAAGLAIGVLPADADADRIVAEIAQNGLDRLVHAFRTGHLDYDMYYRTMAPDIAHRRAAAFLDFQELRHVATPGSAAAPAIARLAGPLARRREASLAAPLPAPPAGATTPAVPRGWDVVVIVEESFGSEFIGALGHAHRKTSPGFDRWTREGTLLTNLTATGNRTVRGLEGTLCSFLPLPGDALLGRQLHGGVPTLNAVLRAAGYRTAFFYGGLATFDGMKPFFPENGVDEFYERDAYPADAFRTIWGVADEYVFARVLARQEEAARRGEHLFATVLTVSNHKPFDVPDRPTFHTAAHRDRDAAVSYADWALADYLDKARSRGLLDHTLVLVVGDHGARVYGAENIPAASYRIPALFVVPDPAWRGRRIERLASQIDLAPTLLALAQIPTDAPFFGEDLTHLPADGGRAFLLHNRDVGILTDHALVTLGLQRKVACYRRSGRDSDVFTRVENCAADPELQQVADDATAVFQTGYEMLVAGEFALPAHGPGAGALAVASTGEGAPQKTR